MTHRMKMRCFAILFVSFFALTSAALANGTERGGGDSIPEEFARARTKFIKILENWKDRGINPVPALKLEEFRTEANATFVGELPRVYIVVDGIDVEVTAVNFPSEKRIVVGQLKWAEKTLEERERIILHEYLSVMKLEGPQGKEYRTSSAFWIQVERDADEAAFRRELVTYLNSFVAIYIQRLNVDYGDGWGSIETIRGSSDYRQCTRREADMSKEKDFLICLLVVEQFKELSAGVTAAYANAKKELLDDETELVGSFNEFMDALSDSSWRNLALSSRAQLLSQFNVQSQAGVQEFQTLTASLGKRCPGRLNVAIVCTIDILGRYIENQAPLGVRKRKREFKQSVNGLIQKLKNA